MTDLIETINNLIFLLSKWIPAIIFVVAVVIGCLSLAVLVSPRDD